MKLIQRITAYFAERDLRRRLCLTRPPSKSHSLDELTMCLQIATEVADEETRADIETNCTFERMGRLTWYDTTLPTTAGPEIDASINRALRYLELRGHLVQHPVQKHLVRFGR